MDIKDFIIRHSAGNLYWKDRDCKYMGCNLAFSKIAHLECPEDIVGKSDKDLFGHLMTEEDLNNLFKIDMDVIQNNKNIVCEEVGINEEGNKSYFLTTKSPLLDQHGKVIGLMGTSIDITKQKESDLMKSQFISNMQHDLRTPFSGIYTIANEMKNIEEDPDKKECLSMISGSAKILLDFCNDVLDFSNIDSQNKVTLNNKVNIKKLLDDVQALENPAANVKSLSLVVDHDTNIPKVVVTDYNKLWRIIINIVGNAIKFTHAGGITITSKLLNKSAESMVLRISIKDTGIGIPKTKQDLIFEKFSKLTQSNSGKYYGLGIGLKIVKTYMADLEGEIDVVSKEGQGTEFILTIPCGLPLTNDYPVNDGAGSHVKY